MKFSGIYLIKNSLDGKCYVGQSTNIHKRWLEHKNIYNKKGKYQNYHLYKAMRKYGVENFTLSILEQCPNDVLTDREAFYYDKLQPEYNNMRPSDNPMNDESVRITQKLRTKESWVSRSEESRQIAKRNLSLGNDFKFPPKSIIATHIETGEKTIFPTMMAAQKALSIPRSSISQIINKNHRRTHSKGYSFELFN